MQRSAKLAVRTAKALRTGAIQHAVLRSVANCAPLPAPLAPSASSRATTRMHDTSSSKLPSRSSLDASIAKVLRGASLPKSLAAHFSSSASSKSFSSRPSSQGPLRKPPQPTPQSLALARSTGSAFARTLMGHPAVWAPMCARAMSTISKVGRVQGRTGTAASGTGSRSRAAAQTTPELSAAEKAAQLEERRRVAREEQLRRAFPEFMAQHAPVSAAAAPAAAAAAAAAPVKPAAPAAPVAESSSSSSPATVSAGGSGAGAGPNGPNAGSDGQGQGEGEGKKSKKRGFSWGKFVSGIVLSGAAAVFAAVLLDERIGLAIKYLMGLESLDDVDEAELAVMPIVPPPETEFVHPLNKSSWFYQTWFRITRLFTLAYVFLPLAWNWFQLWRAGPNDPDARQAFLDALVRRLERAGCSFLKFGQWLSMRPDMFPPDVIAALSQMRDKAPCHSMDETRRVIREQFGVELEEIFESFTPEPVASGSIAQVYKARLTDAWVERSGLHDERGRPVREVAVKVRHPKVLEETWMDVDLIFGFVNNSQVMTVPFSKHEFGRMMQKQVDFRWEGHFLTRFAYNFREEVEQGHLKFPAVSKSLLGEAVLVESWAQGNSVANIFTDVREGFLAPGQKSMSSGASAATVAPVVLPGETAPEMPPAPVPSMLDQVREWSRGKIELFQAMSESFLPAKVVRKARQARKTLLREGEDAYDPEAEGHDPVALAQSGQNFDVALMAKKKRLAFTMFDMFLKMFLRDNLIHGDLHAGNVLFDTAHSACTVLDAGLTVSLDNDVQASFGKFLLAICSGNPKALVERITDFEISRPGEAKASGRGYLATNPEVRAAFAQDIDDICERFFQTSKFMGVEVGPKQRPQGVSIGDVVGQVLFTMQRHNVVLRGDVATSIMAMSVCEGLIRQLDPTLDIVLKSLPYFVKFKGFSSVASITL